MPSTTASGDPVRDEVERRLREIADILVVRPFERVGRLATLPLASCRFVRARLAEPFAVMRSFAELAIGRRPAPAAERIPTSGGARSGTVPADVEAGGGGAASSSSRAAPAAAELPIADYESLAASQVVARLDDLPFDDLAQVRAFESAHRGRRTVLGKVDYLLATR